MPKKSGMRLDTALNHQQRSIAAVINCFSCTRSFHLPEPSLA